MKADKYINNEIWSFNLAVIRIFIVLAQKLLCVGYCSNGNVLYAFSTSWPLPDTKNNTNAYFRAIVFMDNFA